MNDARDRLCVRFHLKASVAVQIVVVKHKVGFFYEVHFNHR